MYSDPGDGSGNFETITVPMPDVSNRARAALWADLNNDGKKDITIYDQNTQTLKTFINVGAAGESKYEYQPRFAKN